MFFEERLENLRHRLVSAPSSLVSLTEEHGPGKAMGSPSKDIDLPKDGHSAGWVQRETRLTPSGIAIVPFQPPSISIHGRWPTISIMSSRAEWYFLRYREM